MTDGNPGDPNTRPMPWDAKPADAGATPPEPEPFDSSPTEVTPTPTPEPAVEEPAPEPAAPEPPAQPGLISAAPVGWGATQGSTLTPPTAQPGDPAAPAVGWAPPPSQAQVPGAPGLVFADTVSRFVAFIIDGILGIIAVHRRDLRLRRGGRDQRRGQHADGRGGLVAFVVILSALYFVFFWTGGRRATPGQRLFNIQVGNAFDGAAAVGRPGVQALARLRRVPDPARRSSRPRRAGQPRAPPVVDRPAHHDGHQPDEAGSARPVRQHGARPPGR